MTVAFFVEVGIWLAQMPAIPPEVKNESTVAVLFMILLGIAFLVYILKAGPTLIAAWRGPDAAADREQMGLLIKTLADTAAANEHIANEMTRLSQGLHERVAPAISGQALAYLILAGLRKTADDLEKKEAALGYPPAQKLEEPARLHDLEKKG